MKKLMLHTPLSRKAECYEPHRCIVEKAVTIPHSEFEQMRLHPVQDSSYVEKYKNLMYYADKTDHCVMFIDEESGDGILVQAEGYDYPRYSQYVSDARGLMESVGLTDAEKKIHSCLRDMTAKIAEMAHSGESHFCFSDLVKDMELDFDTLLRQAAAEMLREREDIQTAEYMPIDIDFQPDLMVKPENTHQLRLVSPLDVMLIPDESDFDEEHVFTLTDYSWLRPRQAVRCQREINDFIEQCFDTEEKHRGLMLHYNSNSSVYEKVFSAFPSAKVVNGELVGVLTCEVCGELDRTEKEELRDWWVGHCSDGWLRNIEQCEIKTAAFGNIRVMFWNSAPDWKVRMEEEMNNAADSGEEENPEMNTISM